MMTRDDYRDAVAYIEVMRRGDAEAASILLEHGDAKGILEAVTALLIGILAATPIAADFVSEARAFEDAWFKKLGRDG